jgi:hypothetical protein
LALLLGRLLSGYVLSAGTFSVTMRDGDI